MGGAGCWCSDGQGKPIPNTTTTSGKPICPKIGKVNIRRSPSRTQSSSRSRSRSRICRRNDQRLFNSNLLKSFYGEYTRAHPLESMPTDKTVLDWKFTQLDLNKDDEIHKLEFREMRRLIRKVIWIGCLTFRADSWDFILLFLLNRQSNQNDALDNSASN